MDLHVTVQNGSDTVYICFFLRKKKQANLFCSNDTGTTGKTANYIVIKKCYAVYFSEKMSRLPVNTHVRLLLFCFF